MNPRGDIRSASFIHELIQFGIEVARVNPTVTTTGETVISEFLNTLWRGGDERKAQAGLNQFFEGVKSGSDRVKLLEFGDRLLDAAQLLQDSGLQTQKKDAKFLSQLLNLGSSYAALNPIAAQTEEPSQFFLDTLLQSGNVQKGATELEESLKNQGIPTSFLNYQWKLLTTTRWVSALKENLRSPEFINEILNAGKLHLELQATADTGEIVSTGIYSDVLKASNKQELINAASTFQTQFLEPSLNSSGISEGTLIAGIPTPWDNIIKKPLIEPNFERYIDQPIIAAAPAKTRSLGIERSVKSIERFIKLVEDEENHYPNTNRNTKMMVTRLRKIFYNSDGWNRILIPGTDDVSIRYTTKDQNTDGNRIYSIPPAVPFSPAIKVDERDKLTIDSQGNSPELFLSQEVKLLDGSFVDMGHVLAAMDAFNHQASVSALGLFKVERNIHNCTWVGDLGSIIGKLVLETARRGGSQVALNEVQEYVNSYAEPQDMLGDIDGIVIGYWFENRIRAESGVKVSSILRQYYIDIDGARSNRFKIFAKFTGLGQWQADTGNFSNESGWLNYYATQVANAAAQYVAVSTSGSVYGLPTRTQAPTLVQFTSQQTEAAKVVLRRFLNTLKIHTARE